MKKLAVPYILLAGILWGCIGLFVRRLNVLGISSMQIVALRALSAAVGMFGFLLVYDRKLLKIRWKDLWCFLGTGLCSILFFNFCYFKAVTLTTMSVASVLLYTAPAFVMVLSFLFFKEKVTVRKICALVMTVVGCALVTGLLSIGAGGLSIGISPESITLSGLLYGLGAGIGYALYSIFSRFAMQKGYHPFTITFYTFAIAFVGCLFFTDIRPVGKLLVSSPGNFFFCILFGLLATVIPYITYTIGLTYVENGIASILASIEPVTATLLGVILYHESMTLGNLAGLIIVLGALAMIFLHGNNE